MKCIFILGLCSPLNYPPDSTIHAQMYTTAHCRVTEILQTYGENVYRRILALLFRTSYTAGKTKDLQTSDYFYVIWTSILNISEIQAPGWNVCFICTFYQSEQKYVLRYTCNSKCSIRLNKHFSAQCNAFKCTHAIEKSNTTMAFDSDGLWDLRDFTYSPSQLMWNTQTSLWKHAYSNIQKISPPKTENFQIKKKQNKLWYILYFCSKHRLWVLVRIASAMRF